jgi:hypothetical protein
MDSFLISVILIKHHLPYFSSVDKWPRRITNQWWLLLSISISLNKHLVPTSINLLCCYLPYLSVSNWLANDPNKYQQLCQQLVSK